MGFGNELLINFSLLNSYKKLVRKRTIPDGLGKEFGVLDAWRALMMLYAMIFYFGISMVGSPAR